MKTKKPQIPEGAPEGTVWFGGPIEWFSIALRIVGDDLVPDEITQLLKCRPDDATEKGKPIYRPDGAIMRIARGGAWSLDLKPEDTDEWDCGEAMLELLARLPSDIDVWKSLSARFKIDFFVGLTLRSTNNGFSLSPGVMRSLADRGIEAGFDICYDPVSED